jgi:hypothetical protein
MLEHSWRADYGAHEIGIENHLTCERLYNNAGENVYSTRCQTTTLVVCTPPIKIGGVRNVRWCGAKR